ncbi:MAG: hypothetical protein RR426_09125 [Oscillospiraceae bacterium]
MCELRELLTQHAHRYPAMEPTDAIKLLYQAEFGGEHLVRDSAFGLEQLEREYQATPPDDCCPLSEDCGDGWVRLNLAAARALDVPPPLLYRLFVLSCGAAGGSQPRFIRQLELLRELTAEGVFGFDSDRLETALAEYRGAGYPAVHHSDAYRAAYRPAYRLVRRAYLPLLPALQRLYRLMAGQERVLLAIDGGCGTGKSTAARQLAEIGEGQVISMDDFFLPPDLRTEARRREPGGNVHYERFSKEVLEPYGRGEPLSYRVFDCGTMDYVARRELTPGRLTIVEGSYSCHPYFGSVYDCRLFLEADREIRCQRIAARNGDAALLRFQALWMPLEDAYFAACHVRERADLVVRSSGNGIDF